MALLLVTQNMKMIDKLSFFICCACLFINAVTPAPTVEVTGIAASDEQNATERAPISESASENNRKPSALSTLPVTTALSRAPVDESIAASQPESKGKLLAATLPTPMKSRKNKNDLFFCCSDDKPESSTQSLKRGKERERNTKPPVLKKGKNPDLEKEPSHERRPALLLRFFPDGTAVIISKFQLHLHVKPKHIRLDSDEDSDEDGIKLDPLVYNPSVIYDDGKSYEISYKGLEAIPFSREQNLDEPSNENQNDFSENYRAKKKDHVDHELVTPSESTITDAGTKRGRPEPILESTTSMETTVTTSSPVKNEVVSSEEVDVKKTEKMTPTVGDSPFFIMTSGEMSSLQQQYDPVHAAPLIATTDVQESTTVPPPSSTTTQTTSTTTLAQTTTLPTTTQSDTTMANTEPTTTTPRKCLSFKTQVSLALSTEDNIDNSLLKKQILPTEDCDNPEEDTPEPFARLQSSDTTVTDAPTTTTATTTRFTTTTKTTTTSTTTPVATTRSNHLPYLSSRLSNDPAKPDVVVVTSLPVLIDLKNSRNNKASVTDAPSWREVTVGVVRDHQGQPLKPRYNNWTAHLRSLKIKPENKFWNELTTSRPDVPKNAQRSPQQQQFQQSQSQVNNAFWTDLQRQRPPSNPHARQKTVMSSQPYMANPPRNYNAPKSNEYQVWRSQPYEQNNNRWNMNANNAYYAADDLQRTKSPMRNNHRGLEREELQSRPPQQWNHSNQRQLQRRW